MKLIGESPVMANVHASILTHILHYCERRTNTTMMKEKKKCRKKGKRLGERNSPSHYAFLAPTPYSRPALCSIFITGHLSMPSVMGGGGGGGKTRGIL